MGAKSAPPLTAAKRVKKGPAGQPTGTVATETNEVDQIVRDAYNAIYRGNVVDQKAVAQRYMEDYKQFIFNAKEASIGKLSGADLQTVAHTLECGSHAVPCSAVSAHSVGTSAVLTDLTINGKQVYCGILATLHTATQPVTHATTCIHREI